MEKNTKIQDFWKLVIILKSEMTTVLAGLYVHSESMSRQKQTEVFK